MRSALRLVRFAARGVAHPRFVGVRHKSSSVVDTFYRTALKSNVSHVSFVVTGAIIFELIYGKATEALWDYCNEGKLPHQVDWSQFMEEEEEDEDEEDEDDEEDEEEEEEEEE